MPSSVLVGSARIDEHGNARGGKAGDQTAKEVSLQDWYKHSKGWVVLRPVSREAGRKIAYDMRAACDNPNIGYDQGERLTLYNAAKAVGFDCAKVTTPCETDCSALVRVCVAYAGITVGNFTTANEASVLTATGHFVKLTDSKYTTRPDYLRAGDILVTKTQGHTVVVLGDGLLAGDDEPDTPAPANPTQPDGSVRVTTAGNYWLRDKPSVLGNRICVVHDGTSVRVYGRTDNGWYGIKLPSGEKGYISGKALPTMGR